MPFVHSSGSQCHVVQEYTVLYIHSCVIRSSVHAFQKALIPAPPAPPVGPCPVPKPLGPGFPSAGGKPGPFGLPFVSRPLAGGPYWGAFCCRGLYTRALPGGGGFVFTGSGGGTGPLQPCIVGKRQAFAGWSLPAHMVHRYVRTAGGAL